MESDYAIRACRYVKRALFMLCRYPAFSTNYIRQNIDTPQTDQRELQDYKNNWSGAKRWRASLLVCIYLYNILRNSYMLYLWLKAYTFRADARLADRAEFQTFQTHSEGSARKHQVWEHVSCVRTNCTRLGPPNLRYGNPFPVESRARLIEDISRLPLYVICSPKFDRFHYTPVTRLDAFGTLAIAVTIYTQFLLGFWIIAQQTFMPSKDDIMMALTSPKVTAEYYRRCIKKVLMEIAYSYRASEYNACERSHSLLSGFADQLEPDTAIAKRRFAAKGRRLNLSQSHRSWLREPSIRPTRSELDLFQARWSSCSLERAVNSRGAAAQSRSAGREASFASTSSPRRGQKLERLVENCLPIIRTPWWRAHQARLTCRILLVCFLFLVACGFPAFYFVDGRLKAKRRLFGQFNLEMSRLNCFVWPDTAEQLDAEHAIQLDQVRFEWTLNSLVNATVLSGLAGCSIALMFTYYCMAVISLGVWLAEMRTFMVASVMVTRFQHQRELAREVEETWAGEPERTLEDRREDHSETFGRDHFISVRRFYTLDNLRRHFKETTHLFHVLMIRRIERRDKWAHNKWPGGPEQGRGASKKPPSDLHRLNAKSSDRPCVERFLAEILFPLKPAARQAGRQVAAEAGALDETDYDVDTIEQIYVNYRLLVDYVQNLRSGMRVAVSITYLLNYGVVLIGVVFRNRFPKLHTETMFLIIFAFIIANYLIFMAADVHANARQVNPLIWSLIAQLTYAREPRVRHLRSLWLKQALVLDSQGGLALSCWGLRITYVYIIQLMLWTATIVGIALKPSAR